MSAYQKGLTGKAAAWAVRKQRQHHQVSNQAIMSIDAVLNLYLAYNSFIFFTRKFGCLKALWEKLLLSYFDQLNPNLSVTPCHNPLP